MFNILSSDEKIKLKNVSKTDLEYLYQLLKKRDPRANISHRTMPTFENHKKFVLSKPYSKWYIIISNNKKIGSIYLSKLNEIGIFLDKDYQKHGVGNIALKLLMEKNPRKRFLANINPDNKTSFKFFKNNGFKLIQFTLELSNDTKY